MNTTTLPASLHAAVHIATSIATPSDCSDAEGALDVDVTLTLGDVAHEGAVTLLPQDFDGSYATWGDREMWCSALLLRAIKGRDDEASILAEIAASAARECESAR